MKQRRHSYLNPLFYRKCQSPEAFHPEKLTRKADVYAFACIIYELMTGKAPFTVSEGEGDRVKRELEQPIDLDDEQWEALQKAFSTAADDRYANCTEMVKAVFPPEKDNAATEEKPTSEKDAKPDTTEAADTTEDGEAPKKSLKDKIPKIKLSMPRIPKYVYYTLGGVMIFVSGYALGWFISDFLNFKEKDLLSLQVQKQEEALQQLNSSLEAQLDQHKKLKQEHRQAKIDRQILQSEPRRDTETAQKF